MFIVQWLIPIMIRVAIHLTVIAVTVYIINRNTLKEIARSHATKEIGFNIKKIIAEGNYNTVTIGLLEANHDQTKEIEVCGEVIEQDFQVGEILKITS